ncbi:hypothetical protein [Desmospora activa]|uniref:Uncharacterized protein n=1 Tax=Desmospora activa DSM 45169 TaxID=1121389 RepID=A0A2T4Z778_9BACL|nr:hypothetical protein [Desmospora activa]PTM57733.1 hypothetical protein C8J48_0285 [Desmospora activa DSM 45169]
MNTSTGCPICNGFDLLEAMCPHCGERMEDCGRSFDLLADYSPYRPIDDMKHNDGLLDLNPQRCPHILYCRSCGYDEHHLVNEQPL